MARIIVLTHHYDQFPRRAYMLQGFFEHWTRLGHRTIVAVGPHPECEAEVAIQHVDSSIVPPEYDQLSARYPVTINAAVHDVRKSAISRALVRPGDDWRGPVIVKADLNCGGIPEWRHNWAAAND